MAEILEPPRKSAEIVRQEQQEDPYWKAVDAYIALAELAKRYLLLETMVERLGRHIHDYEEKSIIFMRVHEHMRRMENFNDAKSRSVEVPRQKTHNLIIEDINELCEKFQERSLDTSWRAAISTHQELTKDQGRDDVRTWAEEIAKYFSRKQRKNAA